MARQRLSSETTGALERLTAMERALWETSKGVVAALTRAGHRLTASQALLLTRLDDRPRPENYVEATYCGASPRYNLVKLADAGYLARSTSAADGRLTLYAPTDKARRVRALVLEVIEAHDKRLRDAAASA